MTTQQVYDKLISMDPVPSTEELLRPFPNKNMTKPSSYQKLKAENKNLRDKISDIEHMFGTMDENERSMIDCAGFITMCRTKIEMERVVMFGDSKRDASKMYLMGSLWDSPQVIKPTKIS